MEPHDVGAQQTTTGRAGGQVRQGLQAPVLDAGTACAADAGQVAVQLEDVAAAGGAVEAVDVLGGEGETVAGVVLLEGGEGPVAGIGPDLTQAGPAEVVESCQTRRGSRANASGVATSSTRCPSHSPPAPRKVATPLSADTPAAAEHCHPLRGAQGLRRPVEPVLEFILDGVVHDGRASTSARWPQDQDTVAAPCTQAVRGPAVVRHSPD